MARVLVIDDEPDICEFMRIMIEDAGHEVLTAANGEQGLELFAREHVDLVITDIFMPESDGLETINAIRKRNAVVPIIAMSGQVTESDADFLAFAKKLGAEDALRKPFTRQDLLRSIEACLATSRAKSRG
jgi:CheY-like chemotaxis protein